VGVPTANVPSSGRRRSKQSILTLPAALVEAVDVELAAMTGMDRADLYRRIVAGELRVASGPGRRWSRGVREGRPPAGGQRVDTKRVSLVWGPGQEEALEARAARLSLVEGGEVTVNEVVGRMLARWLDRRTSS